MDKQLYTIEAITNMHVGNGELNYNIIDKEVQRDQKTQLPNINGSSLKGALRHHCEALANMKEDIGKVFGIGNDDKENSGKGNYRFFEANLLTLPVRSNKRSYFNATSIFIIQNLIDTLEDFRMNEDLVEELKKFIIFINKENVDKKILLIGFNNNESDGDSVIIEDYVVSNLNIDVPKEIMTENIKKLFGDILVIFEEKTFIDLTKRLPVLARNKIDENGKSENLWYEEIVPKKSKFYTIMLNSYNPILDFEEILDKDIIQVGGNASIGYGYSKFNKIGDANE